MSKRGNDDREYEEELERGSHGSESTRRTEEERERENENETQRLGRF